MPDMPFHPGNASLREILRRNYIRTVTQWLLGKNKDEILAQAGNSAWEAGLAIEFLVDSRFILDQSGEDAPLCQTINYKVANVVRWLLSQQKTILAEGLISWDNVTWDTAVVVRGLLAARKAGLVSETDAAAVDDAVVKACIWMLSRFQHWQDDVKYPFGSADVAQILITLTFAMRHFPKLYAQIDKVQEVKTSPSALDLCRLVADFLVRDAERESVQDATTGVERPTIHWAGYENTADIVEALGLYYSLARDVLESDPPESISEWHKHLETIREVLVLAYQWIEGVQDTDGTWGSGIDTCHVLHTYVRIPSLTENLVDALPYRVFKTLRWVCDEKQIFSDGSFQHSSFLTSYYARSLISVYTYWQEADRSVEEIYDDVVWTAPMQTSPERTHRLSLEARVRTLEDSETYLLRQTKQLTENLKKANLRTVKIVLISAFTVLFAVASWIIGYDLNFTTLQVTLVTSELGNFLQFLGLDLLIYFAVCGLIWREYKR